MKEAFSKLISFFQSHIHSNLLKCDLLARCGTLMCTATARSAYRYCTRRA